MTPIETTTSPLARIGAEVADMLRGKMTPLMAQRWMLCANDEFSGMSPVQMIKAGRVEEVRVAIRAMKVK